MSVAVRPAPMRNIRESGDRCIRPRMTIRWLGPVIESVLSIWSVPPPAPGAGELIGPVRPGAKLISVLCRVVDRLAQRALRGIADAIARIGQAVDHLMTCGCGWRPRHRARRVPWAAGPSDRRRARKWEQEWDETWAMHWNLRRTSKRRATFRAARRSWGLLGVCRYPRSVAEKARTRRLYSTGFGRVCHSRKVQLCD